MSSVDFNKTSLQYPTLDRPTIADLDLSIDDGEFVCVLGPSGCGKSTTIRMLAGLEYITGGRIHIDGKDVSNVLSRDRNIAMVFQNYALYPHMTTFDNIGFPLKIAKTPKVEIDKRVREVAGMLDLTEYLERKPANLSGGQRQRIAMGRAIVRHPSVFLMDEPLSNLDAKLRVQTRTQISKLQRRLGVTTLYVTHDQVEAMTMADRIAVLKDGVLQQFATPIEMYAQPANVFVAGFIGSPSMNLLEFPVDSEGYVEYGSHRIQLSREQVAALTSDQVVVGTRPEWFDIVPSGEPGLDATVDMVEELGNDTYLYLSTGESERHLTIRRTPDSEHWVDQQLRVRPSPRGLHLFDARTGVRLPDISGAQNR